MTLLLLLLCLTACGQKTCEQLEMGLPRDQCLHDRAVALPPSELTRFKADVVLIQDPIVRTATLLSWVTLHRGQIPFQQAQDLCQTLGGSEVHTCRRRVEAAHLNR
jgi:hypothetical protein